MATIVLILISTGCVDLEEPNPVAAEPVPAVPTPFGAVEVRNQVQSLDELARLVNELRDLEEADRTQFDEDARLDAEEAVERLARTPGSELNKLKQLELAARVTMQAGGEEANQAAIEWLNYGQLISDLSRVTTEDLVAASAIDYEAAEATRSEKYADLVADVIYAGDQTPAQRDQVASDLLAICATIVKNFEPFEARRYLRGQLFETDRLATISFASMTAICPRFQPEVGSVISESLSTGPNPGSPNPGSPNPGSPNPGSLEAEEASGSLETSDS